jgi:mRNA interferase HigB
MHIIARRAIYEAKQRYPKASSWLDAWWAVASKAAWTRLTDVRDVYPDVDEVGQCLVFNACGNDYRLICRMTYANRWADGTLLVKHFLTHADYDKNKWCKDCAVSEKKKAPEKKG